LVAYTAENGRRRTVSLCLNTTGDGIRMLDNVRTIQMHFGVNISDAARLALHVTADAIRNNRMRVILPTRPKP